MYNIAFGDHHLMETRAKILTLGIRPAGLLRTRLSIAQILDNCTSPLYRVVSHLPPADRSRHNYLSGRGDTSLYSRDEQSSRICPILGVKFTIRPALSPEAHNIFTRLLEMIIAKRGTIHICRRCVVRGTNFFYIEYSCLNIASASRSLVNSTIIKASFKITLQLLRISQRLRSATFAYSSSIRLVELTR